MNCQLTIEKVLILCFPGTRTRLWFTASTLGASDKGILYAHCLRGKKLDKAFLIWYSNCRVGLGFVFPQSEWGHHGTIIFCFTASNNVCDIMGVLYQNHCRSLGFCRVGKGKQHIATRSLIPGSWRLCDLWCMSQMFSQVWRGLLYRQRPDFRRVGSNVTYLSSLKS